SRMYSARCCAKAPRSCRFAMAIITSSASGDIAQRVSIRAPRARVGILLLILTLLVWYRSRALGFAQGRMHKPALAVVFDFDGELICVFAPVDALLGAFPFE